MRQLNKTLEQCKAIKLTLELGKSVFLVAGCSSNVGAEIDYKRYTNTLLSLGIKVSIEPKYRTPNLEAVYYEDGNDISISHFTQPEKVLTGYLIEKAC